jgi:hypothetical protein
MSWQLRQVVNILLAHTYDLFVSYIQVLYRQETEKPKLSTMEAAAQSWSARLVNSVSMLSPLIGPDLHVLVENAFCPHNARSYCGVDLFGRPLFREPCTNMRRRVCPSTVQPQDASVSGAATEGVSGICVGASRHVYYTFAAVSEHISRTSNQEEKCESHTVQGAPDMTTGAIAAEEGTMGNSSPKPSLSSDQQMSDFIEKTLSQSYSGSIVRLMCQSQLSSGRFMCCATMMAAISLPLGSATSSSVTSSSVTSWVQKCLFAAARSQPCPLAPAANNPEALDQPTDSPNQDPHNATSRVHSTLFKQSPLYRILRSLGFGSSQALLQTASSPRSPVNAAFAKLLSRSYPEFELRRICEQEMYVSYSGNAHDGGCLVNTPCFSGRDGMETPRREAGRSRPRASSADDVAATSEAYVSTPSPQGPGYTAVPLHGRASSKFSIPPFATGRRVSAEVLLRGLATAALMVGAIDIVVVSHTINLDRQHLPLLYYSMCCCMFLFVFHISMYLYPFLPFLDCELCLCSWWRPCTPAKT